MVSNTSLAMYSDSKRWRFTDFKAQDGAMAFGCFAAPVSELQMDLFRDLQEEFHNLEATAASQGKPKSLWEELGEIGEEFVEFLERELNITDADVVKNNEEKSSKGYESKESASASRKESSIDDNKDEIEAAHSQLEKGIGTLRFIAMQLDDFRSLAILSTPTHLSVSKNFSLCRTTKVRRQMYRIISGRGSVVFVD